VGDSEQEHGMLTRAVFLRSLEEALELLIGHVRDSSSDLLLSLLRHPYNVLEN
jgi:hypothetical protein